MQLELELVGLEAEIDFRNFLLARVVQADVQVDLLAELVEVERLFGAPQHRLWLRLAVLDDREEAILVFLFLLGSWHAYLGGGPKWAVLEAYLVPSHYNKYNSVS